MITLITGAPGTGKSAALVALLMELSRDRALYVDGIPDLKIEHQPLQAHEWPDVVPDGAAVVIDEVQRVWRPRGPGQKVPPSVAELETHRHRGLDFFLVTQSPRLLDANVRALIGRHVHLRDLGVLGRWWYEWPECNDQCATAWKNAPIKKRYRLPKKTFEQYRSASMHIKPVRSFPMALLVAVVALVVVGLLAWRAYGAISEKMGLGALETAVDATKPQGVAGVISGRVEAPEVEKKPPIDDRIDWIPRISSMPESAPAYDGLRKVVVMPIITGGVCSASRCKCYTQQGTDAGLSDEECRRWIENRPFNPYEPPKTQSQASQEAARLEPAVGDGGAKFLLSTGRLERS